jgi:hypothetical protein
MTKLFLNQEISDTESRLHYEYICLYHVGKIAEFLLFFPDYKSIFEKIHIKLENNAKELYKAYVKRYIVKDGMFTDMKYQNHVYNLHHEFYLAKKVLKINKKIVENYLKNMVPEELLRLIQMI